MWCTNSCDHEDVRSLDVGREKWVYLSAKLSPYLPLPYMDDTILFMGRDIKRVKNLKVI